MESLNLAAAEKLGRQRQTERRDNSPTSSGLVPGDTAGDPVDRVYQEVRRTRVGLALVFSAVCPGLGQLFIGSYAAALIYFAVYVGSLYAAYASLSLWWLVAAVVVWLVNIVHTGVTLTIPE